MNNSIQFIEAFKSSIQYIRKYPRETIGVTLSLFFIQAMIFMPFLETFQSSLEKLIPEIESATSINSQFSNFPDFWSYIIFFLGISIVFSLFEKIYYIRSLMKYLFENEIPTIKDNLIEAAKFFPVIFLASFLYFLMVMVGSLFFLIPGLFLALSFYFFDYTMLHKKQAMSLSFTQSYRISSGYRMQLFGILILYVVISYVVSSILSSFFSNLLVLPFLVSTLSASLMSLYFVITMGFVYAQLSNLNK